MSRSRARKGNVVHNSVSIGANFVCEDDRVVFQATVENNVTVRSGATFADDFVLREGTIVPEGAGITNQNEADALPIRQLRSESKSVNPRLTPALPQRGVSIPGPAAWDNLFSLIATA